MGKTREIMMSKIAGKVRALTSLAPEEMKVALPSFLSSLDSDTAAGRFDDIARALGNHAAREAIRLGVVGDWQEDDNDPRDICYDTWEAEHGDMLETIMEASGEDLGEYEDEDELMDTMFTVYADSFEAALEEELDQEDSDWGEVEDEDEVWDDDDSYLA